MNEQFVIFFGLFKFFLQTFYFIQIAFWRFLWSFLLRRFFMIVNEIFDKCKSHCFFNRKLFFVCDIVLFNLLSTFLFWIKFFFEIEVLYHIKYRIFSLFKILKNYLQFWEWCKNLLFYQPTDLSCHSFVLIESTVIDLNKLTPLSTLQMEIPNLLINSSRL